MNNSGVAEWPLCMDETTPTAVVLPAGCALLQQAAFCRSWEALRGEPVCWAGGRLADRRDTEGQQAIFLIAGVKRPDVTGCAPLSYMVLDEGCQRAVCMCSVPSCSVLPAWLDGRMWCCA